ncbi:MAG: T9SS type A sorting domain-containing protein [Candidatus Coatesbacteria bacterium]|nr:MAG: T9SS type A sorting domain-containing protein [Candidatus Coatesbacteria bacterium]
MKRAILVFTFTFAACGSAFAGDDVVSWARVYADDGEAYASLVYREGLDVASVSPGEYVDVIAPQSTLDELAGTGYSYEYLQFDCLSPELRGGRGYSGYHNYDELESDLSNLADNNEDICWLMNLGDGHADMGNIYALKIHDYEPVPEEVVLNDPNKPDILIVGCHHAREPMTVEVTLSFAEFLCQNYPSNSTVKNIVENMETFIIPCLNPDGWIYDDVEGSRHYWRKNAYDYDDDGNYFEDQGWGYGEGVDLNRNYTYQWGYDDYGSSPVWSDPTYRGPSAGSEPETQVIIGLAERVDFVSALSFHSYGEWILRPWGYIDQYSDDNAKFVEMSAVINNVIYDHLGRNYTACGGWEMYNTNGDFVDYMYGEHDILAVTIELNSSGQGGFYPDDSWIGPTCDMTDEVCLTWADWVWDEFGSVYVASGNGAGDEPGAAVVFALEQSRPNPARDVAVFGFSVPETIDGELAVYDITGRKVETVAEGPFDEGYNEYTADLSNLPSGVYVYRLVAGSDSAAKKIVVNR